MQTESIIKTGLDRYPEFAGLVNEIVRDTINRVNHRAPTIKSEMVYKRQFILEMIVEQLNDKI